MPRRRKTRRAYGSGSVYEKRPGAWVVAWREQGIRRYSDPFPSREVAEQVRAKMERDRRALATGLPLPADTFPTLGTLGDLWLERRKDTHRAYVDDKSRWHKHVRPALGHLRPAEVGHAEIRRFVEKKLADLGPQTVKHCIVLLSTLFTDLAERPTETGVTANPVRTLPRSTRRLYRPTHRPEDTPFLEQLFDAGRIMEQLAEPFRTMYAVGLYGMLRTGEVIGLHAEDVNLDRRVIRVHQQVRFGKVGPPKDDETRIVPIQTALVPLLAARLLAVGGSGPLFPATTRRGGRAGRRPVYIQIHTLHDRFKAAATAAGREDVLEWDKPWYQATRHTGASHWVMTGGDIGTLAKVLGHSTTWVTEHYAHVTPGRFAPADFDRLSGAIGSCLATEPVAIRGEKAGKDE